MFKKGDKVVCINSKYEDTLTLYKSYIILECLEFNKMKYIEFNDLPYFYPTSRFISLNKYRKMKLNKLCHIV